MAAVLSEAAEAVGAGETGVVVGHGAALRTGICSRSSGCRRSLSEMLAGMANCAWAVLELRAAAVGRSSTTTRRPPRAGRARRRSRRRSRRLRPRCARRISPSCRWLNFGGPPTWPAHRITRGCGAAGSAPPWHGGGQGFESPQLHRNWDWRVFANSANHASFVVSARRCRAAGRGLCHPHPRVSGWGRRIGARAGASPPAPPVSLAGVGGLGSAVRWTLPMNDK